MQSVIFRKKKNVEKNTKALWINYELFYEKSKILNESSSESQIQLVKSSRNANESQLRKAQPIRLPRNAEYQESQRPPAHHRATIFRETANVASANFTLAARGRDGGRTAGNR